MFSFHHSKESPPQPHKQSIDLPKKQKKILVYWMKYIHVKRLNISGLDLDPWKILTHIIELYASETHSRIYSLSFFFFTLCWEGLFVSCFGLYTVVCVCLALCVGNTSPILSPESVQVESVPFPKYVLWHFCDSRIFSH